MVGGCWLLVGGWLLLVGGCWLVVDDDDDNYGTLLGNIISNIFLGKKGREKIRVLLVLIFWEKKVGKKLGYFRISEFLILENYGINYVRLG